MKETTMTASDKAVQEAHHKIDRIIQELDEVLKGDSDVLGRQDE